MVILMKRSETRAVRVGNLILGGNNKIYIQSMTTTKTKDVDATVNQILELEKAGCDIVRVCVLDMQDALALGDIKKQIHIPLVADIHFDYKLALEAINQGVDKIRLNAREEVFGFNTVVSDDENNPNEKSLFNLQDEYLRFINKTPELK